MGKYKKQWGLAALLCALALPAMVTATVVRHMNLDTLSENAGVIFRGTVIGMKTGTVEVGGSELPTTTYSFRVAEMFKGEPTTTKNGQDYLTVTMLGSPKASNDEGDSVHFNVLYDVPRLLKNSEYLLFVTPESSVGLTMTVGLQQGCFDLFGSMALNRAQNVGLFDGTAAGGPAGGPIDYRDLADRIRASLGT